MFPRITTQVKDDILHWLCDNAPLGRADDIDLPGLKNSVYFDYDTLYAVLKDFQKEGLISNFSTGFGSMTFVLSLEVKAHTLLQSGGFAVIDALNEANIQKILLELENLKKQLEPNQLESINKAATIMASIATVAGAFIKNK